MRELADKEIVEIIRHALDEDIGAGDITSKSLFPGKKKIQAIIIAGEAGVLAGVSIAMTAFVMLDHKVKFMPLVMDGQRIEPGTQIAYLEGDARAILGAERTALNFLSRLSGVSTLTAKFVEAVRPYKAKIMDTRKTTPGLRILEKYAVSVGGGTNHRMGLHDQILIKDNHLSAVDGQWPAVHRMIERAKKRGLKTEIEVNGLKDFREAIKIKPDVIMLDNMTLKEIKDAVKFRSLVSTMERGLSTKIEVSGGVNLRNVKKIASTGIDMISVGALTHSAKAIDFSLEIVRV